MKQKRYVCIELKILTNMIRRRIHTCITSGETNAELTRMQGWIIGYLYENQEKDVFQKDVEAKFRIRRSTASGILQLMEKKELLERHSVDYDARLKKLDLTPKAISYREKLMHNLNETERQISQGLTLEEIETFFVLIDKMKKNIEKES